MPPRLALPCSILNRTFLQSATSWPKARLACPKSWIWTTIASLASGTTLPNTIVASEFFNLTCNDPEACNNDPNTCLSSLGVTATSCLYDDDCSENCVTVVLTDTQGDGWKRQLFHRQVQRRSGSIRIPARRDSGTFGLCLEDGCYEFVINDGENRVANFGRQRRLCVTYGDPFAINTFVGTVVDMTANAWDLLHPNRDRV